MSISIRSSHQIIGFKFLYGFIIKIIIKYKDCQVSLRIQLCLFFFSSPENESEIFDSAYMCE